MSPPIVTARGNTTEGCLDAICTEAESCTDQGLSKFLISLAKFTEKQEQMMQHHLRHMSAEQSTLRIMLDGQYRDILQQLKALGRKPEFDDQSLIGSIQPGLSQQSQSGGLEESHYQVHQMLMSKAEEPPEMCRRALVGGLPANESSGHNSITAAEVLDMENLPTRWTDESRLEQKAAAKGGDYGAKIRLFITSTKFDIITSVVLLANLIGMMWEMEWRSYEVARLMGDRDDDRGWSRAKPVFKSLDFTFSLIYALELGLRFYALRFSLFKTLVNVCDSIIVCGTFIVTCVLTPLGVLADNPKFAVGRLIMLSWIVRFLKAFRFAKACTELRILARALVSSLRALFWSIILLAGTIISAGVFIFQLLVSYMENDGEPEHLRRWAYENFGSASKSIMAMFEATFTTGWWRFSRMMILEISGYWANFWVLYVVFINFAVMRLIGALFLKQTLASAESDDDKMTMIKLKQKRAFAHEIRQVFVEGDTSGDGLISPEEFKDMLRDPRIGKSFTRLGLEVAEVATLFQLLAADDGSADYEEFLEGALKLTNSVKTIDVIQLLHAQQTLQKQNEMVYAAVSNISKLLARSLQAR
mmetsp:Transcript_61841/g.116969  ORF Transcript_61841/g.116969 Transcript_61841/m.116969 type:complete len:588 (+) Transcript_61841:62-1825(+)